MLKKIMSLLFLFTVHLLANDGVTKARTIGDGITTLLLGAIAGIVVSVIILVIAYMFLLNNNEGAKKWLSNIAVFVILAFGVAGSVTAWFGS